MPRLSFFSEVLSEGEDTHTELADDIPNSTHVESEKNLSRMIGKLICQAKEEKRV